jgi:hypothetical protein
MTQKESRAQRQGKGNAACRHLTHRLASTTPGTAPSPMHSGLHGQPLGTIQEALPLGVPRDIHGPCNPCLGNFRRLRACIRDCHRDCLAAHIASQRGVADEARLAGRIAYLSAGMAPSSSSGPDGRRGSASRVLSWGRRPGKGCCFRGADIAAESGKGRHIVDCGKPHEVVLNLHHVDSLCEGMGVQSHSRVGIKLDHQPISPG